MSKNFPWQLGTPSLIWYPDSFHFLALQQCTMASSVLPAAGISLAHAEGSSAGADLVRMVESKTGLSFSAFGGAR